MIIKIIVVICYSENFSFDCRMTKQNLFPGLVNNT